MRWLLALIPVFGFAGELFFARRSGALAQMRAHPTVMYGDWLLVPLNFLLAKIIDWQRGRMLFALAAVSAVGIATGHAVWQQQRTAPAGFITEAGVVSDAGWVHLAYSVIETVLLLALVFCRVPGERARAAQALAVAYVLSMAAGSFLYHQTIIVGDFALAQAGLFLLLIWPGVRSPRHMPS